MIVGERKSRFSFPMYETYRRNVREVRNVRDCLSKSELARRREFVSRKFFPMMTLKQRTDGNAAGYYASRLSQA